MKNFRKVLSAVFAVIIALGVIPFAAVSAQQTSVTALVDFPMGWSYAAMTEAVENGIIHGYEDNTVRPKGLLTRAEMAAIITRAFGAEVSADIAGKFVDVNPENWFYDVIAKAVQMRVFEGEGNGVMRPNAPITREDALVVLARALVIEAESDASLTVFSDSVSISPYARGHVAAFLGRGYVHGYEDGTFLPKNNITREEFAQMMANIFSAYVRDNGAISLGDIEGEVILTGDDIYLYGTNIKGDLIIGDGVGSTNVTIENVNVEGRIVFRGGENRRVLFANTQKGGLIVVNDYNGTVHFHHYSTEAFFTDGVYNTPATFLDREVAGGTASGAGLLMTHDTMTTGRIDAGTGSGVKPDDSGTPSQPSNPSKPDQPGEGEKYTITFYEYYRSDEALHKVKNVEENTSVSDSDINAAYEKLSEKEIIGYVANSSNITADYDKNVEHKIGGQWYYLDGNEFKVFDSDVVVKGDIAVYYMFNYAKFALSLEDILNAGAFANLQYEAPFDENSTSAITHLDGIALNAGEIKTTINAVIDKIKEQNLDLDGDGNDNYIPVDANNDINNIIYTYRLINLLSEETVIEYTHAAIEDLFFEDEYVNEIYRAVIQTFMGYRDSKVSYEAIEQLDKFVTTYVGEATLEKAFKQYIKWNATGEDVSVYLGDKNKRMAAYKAEGFIKSGCIYDFAADIAVVVKDNKAVITSDDYRKYYDAIVDIYQVLIDEFIDSLHNKETYKVNKDEEEITNDRSFIIKAISKKLANTTVDEILVKLPDFVKNFFVPEALANIITRTIDGYEAEVNAVKALIDAPEYAGEMYYIDSCVDVVINPMEDILIPAYENNKLNIFESEYYTTNRYIKPIEKLIDYTSLFVESASAESGYAVRTASEYYDILYKVAVLAYDASDWFVNNLSETQLDAVIKMAAEDISASYERFKLLMPFNNTQGDLNVGESASALLDTFVGKNNIEEFKRATADRLIVNRTDGFNEIIECIKYESGFDLTQKVSVEISVDGKTLTVKQASNVVEISVEGTGFINFSSIINEITAKIGNSFEIVFEIDEESLASANTLSAYKLYFNDDYVSFKVILK